MPASTNTRRVIRRLLYDEIPSLGFAGTADSVAATTITDAFALADSALGVNHFRGTYIYRPALSSDDTVKKAGNVVVATGVLSHTGTNYSDTADTVYEIVGLLHPDELNAVIQRSLQRVYFETQTVLTLGHDLATAADLDMEVSGTSSWTASNSSLSKITTAANVFAGVQSLRVLNTGANGYAQSQTMRVHPGEPVYMSAIVRADVGTASMILWDVTNATAIKTITSTREGWMHFYWQGNVSSTTEEIAFRLGATGASDDTYWDNVVFYRLADRRIMAPSWLNESYKFLKLRQAVYGRNLAENIDDANSRYFTDWSTPQHFTLDPFNPEAQAFAIQLQKPLPVADLWIQGKRPYYDIETLATDTATTTAPVRQIIAYCKVELASMMSKRYPTDPKWPQLLMESQKDIEAETLSRPEIPTQPIKVRSPLGRI